MKKLLLVFFIIFLQAHMILAQYPKSKTIVTTHNSSPKGFFYGNISKISVTVFEPPFNDDEKLPKTKSIYFFDKNRNNYKVEFYSYLSRFVTNASSHSYEYDDNQNNIKEYSSSFKTDTSYFFYDSCNHLISEKHLFKDTLMTVMNQEYDELGRLIYRKRYELTSKFDYDGLSNKYSSQKIFDKDGVLRAWHKYEYDSDWNWIKHIEITYTKDNKVEKESETIQRFENSKLVYSKSTWNGESFFEYDTLGALIYEKYSNGDIYKKEIIYDSLNNEKCYKRFKNDNLYKYFEFSYEYFE